MTRIQNQSRSGFLECELMYKNSVDCLKKGVRYESTLLTICLATTPPQQLLKSPTDLNGKGTSLNMLPYCCPPLTSTGLQNVVKLLAPKGSSPNLGGNKDPSAGGRRGHPGTGATICENGALANKCVCLCECVHAPACMLLSITWSMHREEVKCIEKAVAVLVLERRRGGDELQPASPRRAGSGGAAPKHRAAFVSVIILTLTLRSCSYRLIESPSFQQLPGPQPVSRRDRQTTVPQDKEGKRQPRPPQICSNSSRAQTLEAMQPPTAGSMAFSAGGHSPLGASLLPNAELIRLAE
ncbi:hypothetical protein Q8A73_000696 [Channa argus]|nr:hypothetical protein Q8A73_000696 [Channa argus]